MLREAGVLPQTRYIVYYAFEKGLWESIDMEDAWDEHTLLTMGMNDGDLPVRFGGPLRLRLPRQLGYKSLKYVNHITATDDIKKFGNGTGSVDPGLWLFVVRGNLKARNKGARERGARERGGWLVWVPIFPA